ncbi:hypothetical protein Tco_0702602 [Tanacetum coccineum]|uniref:Uncharacterized protein n=1 Tax=Tanacetum coccineum TaxID=301880 RepID=A0ABQ4XX37_9ASTR
MDTMIYSGSATKLLFAHSTPRLVVDDNGKISKLAQMDDHVESCLKTMKVPSIMIKISGGVSKHAQLDLRNANHTQTLYLADIYKRFVYEDNIIQRRISRNYDDEVDERSVMRIQRLDVDVS